jgi:hypothetical protein
MCVCACVCVCVRARACVCVMWGGVEGLHVRSGILLHGITPILQHPRLQYGADPSILPGIVAKRLEVDAAGRNVPNRIENFMACSPFFRSLTARLERLVGELFDGVGYVGNTHILICKRVSYNTVVLWIGWNDHLAYTRTP